MWCLQHSRSTVSDRVNESSGRRARSASSYFGIRHPNVTFSRTIHLNQKFGVRHQCRPCHVVLHFWIWPSKGAVGQYWPRNAPFYLKNSCQKPAGRMRWNLGGFWSMFPDFSDSADIWGILEHVQMLSCAPNGHWPLVRKPRGISYFYYGPNSLSDWKQISYEAFSCLSK